MIWAGFMVLCLFLKIKMDNNNNIKTNKISTSFLFLMVLSIIGFADALYLTIKHYANSNINCSIFDGCELVTTSIYSSLFGIPVAVFGLVFYSLVFALIILFSKLNKKKFLTFLLIITSIGFLFSIYFVFVQIFLINAYCLYCLVSAVISTILFVLSVLFMLKYKNNYQKLNFNSKNYETDF